MAFAERRRDEKGYLLTGSELLEHHGARWELERDPLTLETSLPGVFAAGDVRRGALGRVASAVGEGATVVRLVHEHLRHQDAGAPREGQRRPGAPSGRPAAGTERGQAASAAQRPLPVSAMSFRRSRSRSWCRPSTSPTKESQVTSTKTRINKINTIVIPVANQDAMIAFYVEKLGFQKRTDIPFGNGYRWVEVALEDAETSIALAPPPEGRPTRRPRDRYRAADRRDRRVPRRAESRRRRRRRGGQPHG